MIRRVVVVLTAAVALAACGDGEDASRFDGEVERIREAVEAGDRDDALAAFGAIELLALDAHATGDLDDAEVQELARLVEQGRALVDEELPEPTTTTTTTPPPVVQSQGGGDDEGWDDGGDDDDDKEGDRGRGKHDGDRGKGDRDDD